MSRAGFEPATPATKRLQTYALDRADTGKGGDDRETFLLHGRNSAAILTTYCKFRNKIFIYLFILIPLRFFFPVPVCVITASGVTGGTFVSMNRFVTLCG
jgi:hypothetical protein